MANLPNSKALPWSRTNQLIIAAANHLGVRAQALSSRHTDYFMRLCSDQHEVIISKTRSPFLTQVAQTLANNKYVSREHLATHGLPVVENYLVDEDTDCQPHIFQELLQGWQRVVVKPNWGNRGLGVMTNIQQSALLEKACNRARLLDRDGEAVIEPHIDGTNLRICVIGGRYEAAAEIQRPMLSGKSRYSVRMQIAALNRDVRRCDWQEPSLRPMDIIEAEGEIEDVLELYGLSVDDTLPANMQIEIISEELEVIDRTQEIHPDWQSVAIHASRVLGVDVAGIDLRGPMASFRQKLDMSGKFPAVLLEVNALPALHLHALPTQGNAQPVFIAFVRYCLSLPGAPLPESTALAKLVKN